MSKQEFYEAAVFCSQCGDKRLLFGRAYTVSVKLADGKSTSDVSLVVPYVDFTLRRIQAELQEQSKHQQIRNHLKKISAWTRGED